MTQTNLPPRKDITQEQWLEEGRQLFGNDMKQWKFVCPNCGNVQTSQDFRDRGIDPNGKVFYSCIGRFSNRLERGTIGDNKSPCDYTLGGLFVFSSKFVEGTPVFEYYTGDNPTPVGNA